MQCSYNIAALAACWHNLCRHSHDNVLRFILYAGFLQSLNVALTELHIGLGVTKLTGVIVNVLDSHVQLCRSGEVITGKSIPALRELRRITGASLQCQQFFLVMILPATVHLLEYKHMQRLNTHAHACTH